MFRFSTSLQKRKGEKKYYEINHRKDVKKRINLTSCWIKKHELFLATRQHILKKKLFLISIFPEIYISIYLLYF